MSEPTVRSAMAAALTGLNANPVQQLKALEHTEEIAKLRSSDQVSDSVHATSKQQLPYLHHTLNWSNDIHRGFANWSYGTYGAVGAGGGLATVAIAQPVAKWTGITKLPFKQFISHPASLAFIGTEVLGSVCIKPFIRDAVNYAEAYGRADERMNHEGLTPLNEVTDSSLQSRIKEASRAI